MSELLAPLTPTEDPDEIELHEQYAAQIQRAEKNFTEDSDYATKRYNQDIANLRETKNPTPILELLKDMAKRDLLNKRMNQLSEQDLADLKNLLVELTQNPDLTEAPPSIFDLTNEEQDVLDEQTTIRANLRYLLGHEPQHLPTLFADVRLDAAIEAGNRELYRYMRGTENPRRLEEDQQRRYYTLVANHAANLAETDTDKGAHDRERNTGDIARRLLNTFNPTLPAEHLLADYQRLNPTLQAAVIEEARKNFLDAYLYGPYVKFYRPIMPALEILLTANGHTVEVLVLEELHSLKKHAYETAEARVASHLEYIMEDFGSRWGHAGHGRSRAQWYGEAAETHGSRGGHRGAPHDGKN